ncbi:MAG TPA: ABC transporter permease [Candidatus Acidoferrales bacterium]|nr:ABC transporter permease [Candidatus Acidoferrales bacterium]
MDKFWHDVKFGARMLLKSRALTVIAVVTLALGIGANTAIFSLTDQILLRPLPVPRPQELVELRSPGPKSGHVSSDVGEGAPASFSYPSYKDLRDRNTVFSGLLACYSIPLSVSGQGQTERAQGQLVSGNYFETLGVRPALGRMFTQDDDRIPGAHPVAILSHGYWTRRFGASPAILNQQLLVNGLSLTVVGVAQRGFQGVEVGQLPDIFVPITMKAQMTPNWDGLNDRRDYWFAILGRLKPGVSRTQAEAGLASTYRGVLEEEAATTHYSPERLQKFLAKKIVLLPAAGGRNVLRTSARAPLLLLSTVVALVLLIACANVAGLLIARGAARQKEIALRLAMGASRWQLMRQFLTESVLLALAGGALGLILASWTIDALLQVMPASQGVLGLSAQLDARLLAFNLAISALTGIIFGLAPALRATRTELAVVLKEQGLAHSGGLSNVRFLKGLIVTQVAMTALLLVGAGWFIKSLRNLSRADLGMQTSRLLQYSVAPELNGYSPERSTALFDSIREQVRSLPGVISISAAVEPVFADSDEGSNITAEGHAPAENEDTGVLRNSLGPDYFSTMGIPLVAGREFTPADNAGSAKVAIVNETMANRFFSGQNPIGRRFAFGAGNNVHPDIEIVGLVRDSKHSTVRDTPRPFVYLPYAQRKNLGSITFYVRTAADPNQLAAAMRREVARLDANLPVYELKTLQTQITEQLFVDRLISSLSLSFALVAAMLAAIGIYGVMAYTVARRTREIGIRVALGAKQSDVRWMILREVALLAGIGLTVGLPAALGMGRFAESLLYGVKASDMTMALAATVVLAGVALLAGYLPARRAARVDPMVALRYE